MMTVQQPGAFAWRQYAGTCSYPMPAIPFLRFIMLAVLVPFVAFAAPPAPRKFVFDPAAKGTMQLVAPGDLYSKERG